MANLRTKKTIKEIKNLNTINNKFIIGWNQQLTSCTSLYSMLYNCIVMLMGMELVQDHLILFYIHNMTLCKYEFI